MKLTKIALGVTLGLGGLAVNAADVVMFPYVVTSDSVTTVVSIIDKGDTTTNRYNASGAVGALGTNAAYNRLHWRLNYKAGDNATSNSAPCDELDYYLPSSPNDIQTVDLGAHFSGSTDRGVLFNDPSINNNWVTGVGNTLTYAMAQQAGNPVRGVLFVHNADSSSTAQTIQGEAMVFEFQNGAAWGYKAAYNDSGSDNAANDFDFYNGGGSVNGDQAVTFMPLAETTTALFITPLDDMTGGTGDAFNTGAGTANTAMLDVNGGSNGSWNAFTTNVSMTSTGTAGGASGVAFDRDENLVSGSVGQQIVCVGRASVTDLMTSGAQTVLADGGYGYLKTSQPGATTSIVAVPAATVIKLEYGTGTTFNGASVTGVFNNAFQLY